MLHFYFVRLLKVVETPTLLKSVIGGEKMSEGKILPFKGIARRVRLPAFARIILQTLPRLKGRLWSCAQLRFLLIFEDKGL